MRKVHGANRDRLEGGLKRADGESGHGKLLHRDGDWDEWNQ